ncbi:MAG: amidase [Dehalococcoidia bacterium]|nr:amidase [Dehalococcoidia bacterium]
MDTLAYTPAWRLADMVRHHEVSPVELTTYLLLRIERLNPLLNAYLTVAHEQAMSTAREAESALARGGPLPPLHGVPVSVKDLIRTSGIRTTAGSLTYRDFVPHEDATVVERLRRAGAVILGKTNTPEFGLAATTENRLGDPCLNPWNRERTAGGSSGGAAAAVSAGLGTIALGSDGGGSIRIPASFCGVFGFKPSQGLVSHHGGEGGMELFATIGPLTLTVRDAALCLQVISGHDPSDPTTLRQPAPDFVNQMEGNLAGLRVAWSPDLGYGRVDAEVRALAESAARVFETMGCHLEEATPATGTPLSVHNLITMADECAAHESLVAEHSDLVTPHVKAVIGHGRRVTGADYSRALRARERIKSQMAGFFEGYDLLLTPTTAVTAFPLGQRPRAIDGGEVDRLWGPFYMAPVFNITGQPAASLPCGFSAEGLPVGLQVVSRWGNDAAVLRACAAFEKARPWAGKVPTLEGR